MAQTPTGTRPLPGVDAERGACPRCGARHEPLQEYCLECGLRLPLARGAATTVSTVVRRRAAYYPGDWVWPVLVGLVVAALSAATVIVAKAVDANEAAPYFAPPTDAAPPPATTLPPTDATPTLPTTPTPTAPTASPGTTSPPTTTPAQPGGRLQTWPAGETGYTVVVANIPLTAGRPAAVAKAKEASDAGLPEVGILDSGEFASLHPGYFVVFTGIYDAKADADEALSNARANGFEGAYSRQIAP